MGYYLAIVSGEYLTLVIFYTYCTVQYDISDILGHSWTFPGPLTSPDRSDLSQTLHYRTFSHVSQTSVRPLKTTGWHEDLCCCSCAPCLGSQACSRLFLQHSTPLLPAHHPDPLHCSSLLGSYPSCPCTGAAAYFSVLSRTTINATETTFPRLVPWLVNLPREQ